MYHKAKEMLQNARQPKHGGYKTILEGWHKDDQYRKSLSDIGWTEEQIIQYDEPALEDHSCIATREERTRSEKSWVLSLNIEDVQGQLTAEGNTESSFTTNKTTKKPTIRSTWRNKLSKRSSNRMEVLSFEDSQKICGIQHPGLNSSDWKSSEMLFRLPEIWIPLATHGEVDRKHLPHATVTHAQSLHSTDDMCASLKFELPPQNGSFIHASCFTLRLKVHWTPAQALSHLPLLCHCRSLLRTQTCCPRIHWSTVKIHGRMVLLRNSTLPQLKELPKM